MKSRSLSHQGRAPRRRGPSEAAAAPPLRATRARGQFSRAVAAAALVLLGAGFAGWRWHQHTALAPPSTVSDFSPGERRLLAAAAREPSSPWPYQELAEQYMGSGRPASALWAYAEAVARAPGDSAIRLKLAADLASLGYVGAAEAMLRPIAAGRGPTAAPARQALARLLLSTGRPAAALGMLRGAGPDAAALRGRAQEALGNDAAAAACYRRAAAASDAEGDERLARLELATGHLAAAQEAMRALAGLRAAQPSDLLLVAAIHAAAGTPQELHTALTRVLLCLRLQPRSAEAHYQAALLFLRVGNRAAAVDHLERAVQLDPNHAEARGRLADLLQTMGQTTRAHRERAVYEELKDQSDRALAEFRCVGDAGPPDDLVRARITVDAAQETEQVAAVARQTREELERRPGDTGLMLQLGLLYRHGGSRAPLEQLCRDWMARQPASGMPYWLLGGQAMQEMQSQDAIHLLETAWAKEPHRADFCLGVGLAYMAAGTPDSRARARPWLEKAIALDPRAPGPHQQLGWALDQRGDLEAARSQYLQFLDLQPGDAGVLNNLVRVLTRQRQAVAARLFAALARSQEVRTSERQQLAGRVRDHPAEAEPRVVLAHFLTRQGQLAAARNQLERAAESSPAARPALAAVDRLLRVAGDS